ncbi:MAG TPA: ABC transporter permease subunit [Vicinamibacterales bacterium]|jgi:Cu-processing system permease protein
MKPRSWAAVWLCARQELRLSVRSRWTQTFTVVFAALALAVSASGYVLSGGSGIQDFARTAASLVQLVLLLVPLTSLVFGAMALTPDAGAAELIFSQPIARQTVLAGRLLGVFLAIVSAESIGFGAAGLLLFARTGPEGILSFLGVVGGALVLTAVFLALAALVAAGGASTRRSRNLALVLVVWFVAVVLFDVAALGVASLLPSGLASRVLMVAAIANPVDAVRTGTLLAVEGPEAFGAGSLAFLRFTGGAAGAAFWLAASVFLWILAPLSAAVAKLNRADI